MPLALRPPRSIVRLGGRPGPSVRPDVAPAGETVLETFDVFETVLVRAVTPPSSIFDLVGERAREEGLLACSAQAFAHARNAAARRAALTHRDAMDLAHIYTELGAALGVDAEVQLRLAELELAEEARQLRPIPAAAPRIAASRARAGRVVYVSDMYLPASFIQEQLRVHGFWEESDVLYVSFSHGRTKRNGGLFELVAQTEGVPVGSIRHHGNDLGADVTGARRAGAQPVLLADGNPNRYEKALQRYRQSTDGLTASMAGASRLARLQLGVTDPREAALVDVAAGVMAPVLSSYVLWLLRRAQALGLERLYFVARDGKVLLRIAEQLAPRIGCDIELRYLYASRLVWNRIVASPTLNPEAWNSLVRLSNDGVSNRDVLARTGIGRDEVDRVVAESGLGTEVWDSVSERAPLWEALDRIGADGTLAAAAERNSGIVLRHLEQEGLFDDVPHGFVDVGWRGTQHDSLLQLQQERGVALSHGLFFGLDTSASSWGHHREAFFSDLRAAHDVSRRADLAEGDDADRRSDLRGGTPLQPSHFTLLEVFCSADHGTVTDYVDTPDGIAPVLTEGREKAVEAWGLPLVWRAVDAYVANLGIDTERPYLHVDVHGALMDVMNQFWNWPTRDEVAAWARFPWEVGQGEGLRSVHLARQLRLTDIPADVRSEGLSVTELKRAIRRAQKSEWAAASVLSSPPVSSVVLRPGTAARQAAGRTIRGLRAQVGRRPRVAAVLRRAGL